VSRSVDQVRGIDLLATPRGERIVGVVEKHSLTQLSSCVVRLTNCSIEFKRLAPDGRSTQQGRLQRRNLFETSFYCIVESETDEKFSSSNRHNHLHNPDS
jgi:hypothetical protein